MINKVYHYFVLNATEKSIHNFRKVKMQNKKRMNKNKFVNISLKSIVLTK